MDNNIAKAIDLEIDKTFAAIAETNKAAGTALASYVISLLTAIALTFGKGLDISERVTVPLLQLSMNRGLAAAIALLLSSAALYRWMLSSTMEDILVEELENALRRRYGGAIKGQFLYRHTSIIRMTTIVFAPRQRVSRLITVGLTLATLVGTFVMPGFLAWNLTQTAQLAAWQNYGFVILAAASTFPAFFVIMADPTSSESSQSLTKPNAEPLILKVLNVTTILIYTTWMYFLLGAWGAEATRFTPLVTIIFVLVATITLGLQSWEATSKADQ